MCERAVCGALAVGWILLAPATLGAHPLAPSLFELHETEPGHLRIRWKTPARVTRVGAPQPVLPRQCQPEGEPRWTREGSGHVVHFEARCDPAALVGSELGVDGLVASRTEALLEIELSDGRTFREVLRGSRPRFVVPERPRALQVAESYVALGARHILSGFDHLAFVFGLMLLVGRGRPLFWAITAFTAGHSVTLSLAALGFVAFPVQLLEVAIAGSLVALGVELVRRERGARVSPALAPLGAALFGLLHGLGFAGALHSIGLPPGSIPLSLVSFNVGVEVGQLAFIGCVLLLQTLLSGLLAKVPTPLRWLGPYAVGCSGAFWFFDRLLGH
ncbi:MAG: HupE/UreJ family protein [Myxococcales bacterium]|nr:HupE/UreJ family protein [Myxococcales bacterium]